MNEKPKLSLSTTLTSERCLWIITQKSTAAFIIFPLETLMLYKRRVDVHKRFRKHFRR